MRRVVSYGSAIFASFAVFITGACSSFLEGAGPAGDAGTQPPDGDASRGDGSAVVDASDPNLEASSTPQRIVFVSSRPFAGNLGGLAGADAACRNLAAISGVPEVSSRAEKFKALLAAGGANPFARFTKAGPYVVRTTPPVVVTFTGFTFMSSLVRPIEIDEKGQSHPGQKAWTGILGSGQQGANCLDWTSSVATESCDKTNRLYCVED